MVLGCLCFVVSVGVNDKFDSRVQKCVLLRCSFGFKGCKLYNLNTKTVFHSRNVLFSKDVFPFKGSKIGAILNKENPTIHITPTCEP